MGVFDGDTFPSFTGQTVNHGEMSFPDAVPAGNYAVLAVYRAHW